MKDFHGELIKMHQRLREGNPFAFSKFADGEWMAMSSVPASNGEWIMNDTTPGIDATYAAARLWLWESFQYRHPDYYVGVSCSCCQGQAHRDMVVASGQSQDNLTYANLWVNANYEYFLDEIILFFQKTDKPIILFANAASDISQLPFTVTKFYPIHYNSWVNPNDYFTLEKCIQEHHKNSIFLFSAGPFGNIAIKKLWEECPDNIYLDIGSTVDRWLSNDRYNKRCYAIGDPNFSRKVCIWD